MPKCSPARHNSHSGCCRRIRPARQTSQMHFERRQPGYSSGRVYLHRGTNRLRKIDIACAWCWPKKCQPEARCWSKAARAGNRIAAADTFPQKYSLFPDRTVLREHHVRAGSDRDRNLRRLFTRPARAPQGISSRSAGISAPHGFAGIGRVANIRISFPAACSSAWPSRKRSSCGPRFS